MSICDCLSCLGACVDTLCTVDLQLYHTGGHGLTTAWYAMGPIMLGWLRQLIDWNNVFCRKLVGISQRIRCK